MNCRRDMRATIAEKSALATSIASNVAVNIHGRFSTPLEAPISSRTGTDHIVTAEHHEIEQKR